MDLGLFSSGELRAQEVRIFRLSPEGVHRQSAFGWARNMYRDGHGAADQMPWTSEWLWLGWC